MRAMMPAMMMQADAVADAVFVDLLADPHQEDRADGHGDDGDETTHVPEAVVMARVPEPGRPWLSGVTMYVTQNQAWIRQMTTVA